MILIQWNTCLVFTTLIAFSLGQDNSSDVCRGSSPRAFSLAEIEESVQTGSVQEAAPRRLPAESSNWCNNHVNIMYRTNDGTCNHPNNFGAAGKPIERLLPPDYDDGFDTPRQRGKDGQPLPSARNVSLTIHPARDVFASFPILLMQWGQWLAHDLVATATSGGDFRCCGPNGGCPSFLQDTKCFPIEVPANDPTLPGICLEFARSLAANGSDNLPARPRQQINAVTSYLDCSQIYGSSDEVAASVREPGGFLLRNKNGFPPEGPGPCIRRPNTDDYCFLTGDLRGNQHPYLGALHTLWIREHNYIARNIREVNKTASDEEIFQKTKNVIIAIHQMITYNVYLPIVLGDDAELWKLTSLTGRSIYNQGINPTVIAEFSSAGFRFGHSTVPSKFPIGNQLLPLRDLFNRPHLVVSFFDSIIGGIVGKTNISIQSSDRFFTEELTRFLFFNNNTGRGGDLVSNNIQRARDHGLAPYVKWRSFFGLRPLTGFNDTEALGPNAPELAKVFTSINSIDLYTGMLHERPVKNGIVGPTTAGILRIHFYRLKYGDRHFFDNTELSSGFSDAQLASIRKVRLSQIMCRHTTHKSIQLDVFRFPSRSNPEQSCEVQKRLGLDFSLFA